MKPARYQEVNIRHQIAPLIDVVFLLLIYFMVSATIMNKEGGLAFVLPLPNGPPLPDVPIHAYIQIDNDGMVMLEGMRFDSDDRNLKKLVSHVAMLREIADAQQSEFVVTLAPEADAQHGRVVDVMDACRNARVRHLAFASSRT